MQKGPLRKISEDEVGNEAAGTSTTGCNTTEGK